MALAQQLRNQKKKMILLLGPMRRNKTTINALPKEANAHYSSPELKMLCKQGRVKEALHILHGADQGVGSSIYASLLQVCVDNKVLPEGKLTHAHIIQTGFKCQDIFLENTLLNIYAKCGSLVDARRVWDRMPKRNVISWTVMIAAYTRHGFAVEALTLFYQMQRSGIQPDPCTFSSVLPACANMAALEQGEEIHEEIIRSGFQSNVFVGNALIDMYAKCGIIESARMLFDSMQERNVVSWTVIFAGYAHNGHIDEAMKLFRKMPERNVVSWTAMIATCAKHGRGEEALTLFYQMQQSGIQPNQFTFASVLSACANVAALEQGKKIHEEILRSQFQSNVFVGNALLDMYAKCGSIKNARNVFDRMPQRDVVSWNAMIAGYTQNGHLKEAVKLFRKMPEQNVISWNGMITGYAQNGQVDEALKLFQKMPEQDVVSWNAMIAGYAQNGHGEKALKLFRQMQLTGLKPNSETFTIVLPTCADLAALDEGKEVHEVVIRSGYQSDVFLGNTLVDMYAKCGSIEDACHVFNKMPVRNVVSWTSMIVGYAVHGCGKEALQLFEQMRHSGTHPDHVTFLGVLSACCHAGLVDEGWQYFDCMSQYYHITPAKEHYGCMVDLLGRAGRLDEANQFINEMPIKPDAVVWGSLLGACRIHTNVELGKCAAEHLLELDPENGAHYVLLSDIYAAAGRLDDIEKVWKRRKDRKIKKKRGCSWIVVNKKANAFLVRDRSHPQIEKIYAKLERLSGQMKAAGYVPNT
eukprot:Gb_22770 [translate_table: standard]